jgi:hypothetical protein
MKHPKKKAELLYGKDIAVTIVTSISQKVVIK